MSFFTYCLTIFVSHQLAFGSALEQQVKLDFYKKFEVVTPDIGETSQKNIENLLLNFRAHRNYDENLNKAKSIVKVIDKGLAVYHGTSARTATAIIRSQEFLSLDELIRRKVIDISKKFGSRSEPQIDGVIGEQDVVFFSIEPKNTQTDNIFGEIVFELDKPKLIEIGYFSLSIFGVGLTGFRKLYPKLPFDFNGFLVPEPYLIEPINTYSEVLFKGQYAYQRLLEFSVVQNLWESDTESMIHDNKLLDDFNEFKKDPSKKTRFTQIDKYFIKFNQTPSSKPQFPKFWLHALVSIGLVPSSEEDDLMIKKIIENDMLTNYSRFPWSPNGTPGLLLPRHYFWELKVPKKVSINLVKSIRVPKFDQSSDGVQDLQALAESIKKYARKSNRDLTISREGKYTFYKFD